VIEVEEKIEITTKVQKSEWMHIASVNPAKFEKFTRSLQRNRRKRRKALFGGLSHWAQIDPVYTE